MRSRKFNRRICLVMGLGAVCAHSTFADTYPSRPIRLVVPFAAGPGPDFLARVVARKLEEQRGWTVIVDNRPGAGGNIGTGEVAKAKSDGYTLLFGHVGSLAVNPSIYPKLGFDPKKDLAPIGMVGLSPLALVTGMDSRYKTLDDVIAAATKGATISFGYSGTGTISHLSGALLAKASGTKLQNIPYKTANQGVPDLVAGRLDLYMSSVATLTGYVQGGKLRALAVTSAARYAELPAVPTVAEQGFPGFDASTWFALMAPSGIAPEIVSRINEALNAVLNNRDIIEKFKASGTLPKPGRPEDLAKFIDSESLHWGRLAVEIDAKVE